MNTFLDNLLGIIPLLFALSLYALSVYFYHYKRYESDTFLPRVLYILSAVTISFRIGYALVLTLAQYYVWKHNEFSQLLLPPYQPLGYFLEYSGRRFWLSVCISFGVTFVWYLLLKVLQKYRSLFFSNEEIILSVLMSLVVGWPNFVLFIPMLFLVSFIFLMGKIFITKERRANLRVPIFVSTLLVLIFGNTLVDIFHLTVLRV